MPSSKGSGNLQHDLNHCMPAAHNVRLGDTLADLIAAVNLIIAGTPPTVPIPNRLLTQVPPESADRTV
jgi:hypothetical protein